MCFKRSFFVLVVVLGSLDIWSVEGTKIPRTTRPAKTTTITSTTDTKKAEELDVPGEKKYYYRPKPTHPATLRPAPLVQLPTVRPSLPPPPPSLYPVPGNPSYNPPQLNRPTGVPSHFPPFQTTAPPAVFPPTFKPTNRPIFTTTQHPIVHFPPIQSTAEPTNKPTNRPIFTSLPTIKPDDGQLFPITDRPELSALTFDRRYPDGSYEFRYELADDTVRYEWGQLVRFQHKRILVVKGYYSYRVPDRRFYTVIYTADQNGYQQDYAGFSARKPKLPVSLRLEGILRDELRTAEDLPTTTQDETTLASE